MLDTNILIYLLKNRPAAVADKVNALPREDRLSMSFFTYAELLKGAERSTKKTKVLHRLEALTCQIPVLYLADRALCDHYAKQVTRLQSAGTPIGVNDLWIACHALAEGCVLVTNNLSEFERVQGLSLENWVNA